MTSDRDVDVLIAGAGPAGLTAALQLARWGARVRIVDSKAGPATTSRALNTHSRTLEMYDQLGVLGDIAPFGIRVNAFVRHEAPTPYRLEYAYDGLATRFPFMFMVDQVITERVLRGHASAAGAPVEWNTTLQSFRQDTDGVDVQLKHLDGHTELVRAEYLWGCDGGHSVVRKALGLPLQGSSTYTWLIADALIETSLARDALHWMFPPGGLVMLFPFPDAHKWRLLDTSGEGDPKDLDQIGANFSVKISQALGQRTQVATPTWASAFTIQQRAVPAMHVGRCFVSGDAAHVHSPASGQGMNTSMQDAYNLAWKLAMVLQGNADPGLLNTYDDERVPIGQALLATTGEVMEIAMLPESAGNGRESDKTFLRQLVRGMSGLTLQYANSELTLSSPEARASDKHRAGPQPGERLTQVADDDADSPAWTTLRAALRRPTWHLLAFDAVDQPRHSPTWLSTILIAAEPGREKPAGTATAIHDPDLRLHRSLGAGAGDWILVRPDGYLSARGNSYASDVLDHILPDLPYLRSHPVGGGASR